MVNELSRDEAIRIAKEYVKIIKNDISVRKAYLYGSSVKGQFKTHSDIDIAIFADDFTGDVIEDLLKLMKLRRKVDNRIEPHPFSSDDFEMGDPFVDEIIKTGIEIT